MSPFVTSNMIAREPRGRSPQARAELDADGHSVRAWDREATATRGEQRRCTRSPHRSVYLVSTYTVLDRSRRCGPKGCSQQSRHQLLPRPRLDQCKGDAFGGRCKEYMRATGNKLTGQTRRLGPLRSLCSSPALGELQYKRSRHRLTQVRSYLMRPGVSSNESVSPWREGNTTAFNVNSSAKDTVIIRRERPCSRICDQLR